MSAEVSAPLSPMAARFAELIARLSGSGSDALRLAAGLAVQRITDGMVCLDLAEAAGQACCGTDAEEILQAPELSAWKKELRESGVVGSPGEYRPLILDESHRLYLARYWSYERRLAESLLARSQSEPEVDQRLLESDLEGLFPPAGDGKPDWQRIAAETAVTRRFCVISGGPGTGKTTTVVRILAALLSQARGKPVEIALAAPTGKAAARMQEILGAAKAVLRVDPAIAAGIPEHASTLHRLLGARTDSTKMRYHRRNPLPADVVVVDEASMVDLALMAKLCDALQPHARLILLGDKDQLASVEAGAVLGDICAGVGESVDVRDASTVPGGRCGAAVRSPAAPHLADSIVLLRKNYRFGEASGIGRVSALVNAGDGEGAAEVLAPGAVADTVWRAGRVEDSIDELRERVLDGYAAYLRAVCDRCAPGEVIPAFDRFRVLCAHRRGPAGVEGVNRMVEGALRDAGLIRGRSEWYPGRPVMVTENDYNLRLFNGDIGIAIEAGSELRVFFAGVGGSLRGFAAGRLPPHVDVWASTVHKSQGSEFDEVLLVLPDEPTRVMTRELVYTALTRARARAELWGPREVLVEAVSRKIERSSGLRDRLWGGLRPATASL
ncbi:MAG: exodeoxyribonuclease V subunit alpha [Acidobacteriota bacterium]